MRKIALILLCTLGFAGHAVAHALLEHAVPPVGGTVSTPPGEVAITFSERLEPAFSTIAVTDATGRRVDLGKARTAPDSGNVLIVDLQPLGPGAYTVTWRAISVDTHKTQGSYGFTVAP